MRTSWSNYYEWGSNLIQICANEMTWLQRPAISYPILVEKSWDRRPVVRQRVNSGRSNVHTTQHFRTHSMLTAQSNYYEWGSSQIRADIWHLANETAWTQEASKALLKIESTKLYSYLVSDLDIVPYVRFTHKTHTYKDIKISDLFFIEHVHTILLLHPVQYYDPQ